MNTLIRKATSNDMQDVFNLIVELAIYEKAPNEVINSPQQLVNDGFGQHPLFICFVAELEGKIIGMSLNYIRYSTWKGPVLYLEDLIVTDSMRGKGIGKELFQHTLNYAKENGFKRLQWQVLDWNQPAINFYQTFKAGFDPEWLNAWVDF